MTEIFLKRFSTSHSASEGAEVSTKQLMRVSSGWWGYQLAGEGTNQPVMVQNSAGEEAKSV